MNRNEVWFEAHYRRRLKLPVRWNFEVQTKLTQCQRLIAQISTWPRQGSAIDIGLGRNTVLFTLPVSWEIGGVDITTAAVEQARRRAANLGYRRCHFQKLDVEKERLPWPDSSVDLAIASHIMEHLRDDRSFLLELARVLKSGGHLVLMIPINETDRNANPLHLRRYSSEAVKDLLCDVGLRPIAEDTAHSLYGLLEALGRSALPTPLAIVRGKIIGLIGAGALLFPALWNLPWWGPPRDYGVVARKG